MNFVKFSLAGAGLMLIFTANACGLVKPHVDCDQVAQEQRAGTSDENIAQTTGFTVTDVQSCSQTASSGGKETANNYQDQPHLPYVPSIPSGAITRF
jgi:hypothetical protein